MAGNVKNILVGAARVFVSTGNGSNRPDLASASNSSVVFPVIVSGNSAPANDVGTSTKSAAEILGTTASPYWKDMGYTNNGVEISYEPGYGEVQVDQLLDAARLFKQTLRITMKTEIAEGTLENLNIVFGQADQVTTYSPGAIGGSAANTSTLTTYNSNNSVQVLRLAAGALGEAPVERTLVVIGQAPGQVGRTYENNNASASAASAVVSDVSGKKRERIYVARRVVQMSTTAHALKRDGASVYPVEFRCLPDDDDKYDGSEYGFIVDRVYSA